MLQNWQKNHETGEIPLDKCCTVIWVQHLFRKDTPNCGFLFWILQASFSGSRIESFHAKSLPVIVVKLLICLDTWVVFSRELDREKPGAKAANSWILPKCRISELLFSWIAELHPRTGLYFLLVLWEAASQVPLFGTWNNFNSCCCFEVINTKKGWYQPMWNLAALWHGKLGLKWCLTCRCLVESLFNRQLKC